MAGRLQRSAAQCQASVSGSDVAIWLWIYITGASAAKGWDQIEEWFLKQGTNVAKSLTVTTYVGLEEVLACYIFFDNLQGHALRQLALRLGMDIGSNAYAI